MMIIMTACGTASTNNFCDTYIAVPTLHCGSDKQKLNVDKNNAVYLEKCLN